MAKSKLERSAIRALSRSYYFPLQYLVNERIAGGESVLRAAKRMSFSIPLARTLPDGRKRVFDEPVVKVSDLEKWVKGE